MKLLKDRGNMKPCPFCGENGRIATRQVDARDFRGVRLDRSVTYHFFGCFNSYCKMQPKVPTSHDHEQRELDKYAIELWNHRAGDIEQSRQF